MHVHALQPTEVCCLARTCLQQKTQGDVHWLSATAGPSCLHSYCVRRSSAEQRGPLPARPIPWTLTLQGYHQALDRRGSLAGNTPWLAMQRAAHRATTTSTISGIPTKALCFPPPPRPPASSMALSSDVLHCRHARPCRHRWGAC